MGTWIVYGGVSVKIARPARVAKKFTFYIADQAPSSSGIKPGKSDNGKVVFTFIAEQRAIFKLNTDLPLENKTTTELFEKKVEEKLKSKSR